jgi:hypothetical protein
LVTNPTIRSPIGNQYEIGLIDQFYIGWAHQYIRTKQKCIGGPGQYKIGQGDQSYIGRLRATLLRGFLTNTTPFAVLFHISTHGIWLTPLSFCEHVSNTLLPQFGINKTISLPTATFWMGWLEFSPQEYYKLLDYNGHERSNVVEAQNKYVEDFDMYQKCSWTNGGESLEDASKVDPEILGYQKETNFIFHEKLTVHAKEKT